MSIITTFKGISYFLSTQKSSEKGLEQQSIHKDQEPQRK